LKSKKTITRYCPFNKIKIAIGDENCEKLLKFFSSLNFDYEKALTWIRIDFSGRIRIRINFKSWIRIRHETNTDPKHCPL